MHVVMVVRTAIIEKKYPTPENDHTGHSERHYIVGANRLVA